MQISLVLLCGYGSRFKPSQPKSTPERIDDWLQDDIVTPIKIQKSQLNHYFTGNLPASSCIFKRGLQFAESVEIQNSSQEDSPTTSKDPAGLVSWEITFL